MEMMLIQAREAGRGIWTQLQESCFVTATVDVTETEAAKQDFCNKLRPFKKHWPAFREHLVNGLIDGRSYVPVLTHDLMGILNCSCFVGTLARLCGLELEYLPIKVNALSPVEMWFRHVLPGMTPENNERMAITLNWFDEFVEEQNKPKNHWIDSVDNAFGINAYMYECQPALIECTVDEGIYQRRNREMEMQLQMRLQQLSQMHIHSSGMMITAPGRYIRGIEAFSEHMVETLELEEV